MNKKWLYFIKETVYKIKHLVKINKKNNILTTQKKGKIMSKNGRAISVDGKLYSSLSAAAKAYDFNKQSLYQALHRGTGDFKGHKVFYSVKTVDKLLNVDENSSMNLQSYQKAKSELTNTIKQKSNKPKSSSYKACPVKCITTGKTYKTISAAAKEAGVNMWTMSMKMEEVGKFTDKNKNEYIRLAPMVKRTDRKYVGYGTSSIERVIERSSKNKQLESNSKVTETVVSQDELITQALLKSATLLATSKKYSQAANIFDILADLYQ